MRKKLTLWFTRGTIMLFIYGGFLSPVWAQTLLKPNTQPQFVHPLPIPAVLDGRTGGTFTIGITQFEQWLGLVDPLTGQQIKTTVWGYQGSYPGPTILAKKDVPLKVYWHNNLVKANGDPLPHLLPVDESVHWALDDKED
jgi:spore coat protein A, manganese oxidase